MKTLLTAISILISISAYSFDSRGMVYKVTGIKSVDTKSGWIILNTITGSTVNVNCARELFDDVVRDQVGGFKNKEACELFIEDVKKYANKVAPMDVEINNSFGITYKINL